MQKTSSRDHGSSSVKTVGFLLMAALAMGALLLAGCDTATGYDPGPAPRTLSLLDPAELPDGDWYTHLTGSSAQWNTVITIDSGTITYTGSWAAYDYVASIYRSVAFDDYSGAYVVQFTTAPADGAVGPYYVIYYNDYDGTTAQIADAYSDAYDPGGDYTSVRWEVSSDILDQTLEAGLDTYVDWDIVSPYYYEDPPAE